LSRILSFPLVVFVLTFLVLWLSVKAGAFLVRRTGPIKEGEKNDIDRLSNASLTLLALIIGFSFSMAVSRYDQRKNYEEEEANAIGTEYVRVDLLPAADAAKIRSMLLQYLDLRLQFYTAHELQPLHAINAQTEKLQDQMWSAVQDVAHTQPNAPVALVVAGMNDVLNRQGYTQAAWWNRIPAGAWCLMSGIAICSCILTGGSSESKKGVLLGMVPFLVAIAFFFIADIDSPRRGVIHVAPQNLISLSQELHGH
jgi:hypothetical protein